jgi:hypothetical protein
MEILDEEVLALTKTAILDLAYTISKKLDLSKVIDEQVVAGQLCSLKRVIEDQNSLIDYATRQQVLQGLIIIGNLNIN